jgi:hypothetical protein
MKLLFLLLGVALATACSTVPSSSPPPHPQSPLRLGTVEIDAGSGMVIATGHVNQVEGPVEFLACGPAGKLHESVLVLAAKPLDLQAALLALRLKSGPPMRDVGMGPPVGDTVAIWVAWTTNGVRKIVRADELLWNRRDQAVVKSDWIFTGSTFIDGKFKAMDDQSLIATYWDPWSIVNLADSVGGDDDAVFVKRDAIPPLGTEITLYIQRR